MICLRALIPALFLTLPSLIHAQAQQPYQLTCDAPDASNSPSTPLDDWINSLLTVLHDNARFSFEQVLVAFAGTEDGYDVLEGMWESTAKGGQGENWSLLVPSDAAFTASGLTTPYSSLDEPTLYSIFTYHALPLDLSALTDSSTHFTLETLYPLTGGAGSMIVGEMNGGDKIKVLSPTAATITLDTLDEGSQIDALSGLKLYNVDSLILPPTTLLSVLDTFSNSTSTSAKQSGLSLYTAALGNTKTINTLTGFESSGSKGLTILAPVDEAFDGNMTSDNVAAWTKVLAGHYSSSQTVYSTGMTNSSTKLYMANGNALSFQTNSSGTFAISSDGISSAKVLRSDILLQGGGVMHIVDTLLSAAILKNNAVTNGTGTSTGTTINGLTIGGAGKIQVGVLGMMLVLAVTVFGTI